MKVFKFLILMVVLMMITGACIYTALQSDVFVHSDDATDPVYVDKYADNETNEV